MRVFFVLLAFSLFLQGAVVPSHANTETIAAVVNSDAISMSDLADRMKLIMVSSGLPNTDEVRKKLMGQVLSSLIEEQLKIQEARRLKIQITHTDVAQGFATIAGQNKMSAEQFQDVLSKSGINIATMERQIEAQLAWTKIVQSQIRPKVSVTDKDVDDMMERLTGNTGNYEYLVAEVFLPVEDPKVEGDTRKLAEHLISEINSEKTTFYKVAQQFSKAAGAAEGGDLGWIQQGQLPDELGQAIADLTPESISAPVRSATGYHILLLREKRQVTGENIPSREQIMSDIGTKKMERLQRRYYLDLKAQAFIENRVNS
jgi:peptidyl-prolyl cis-trans isomerase SurA